MSLIILLLFLSGCHQSDSQAFMGTEMTIPYRIVIGQPLSFWEKRKVETIIATTFDEVNQIYNNWNPNSELSQLNRLRAHEKKVISQELHHLLQLTDRIVTLTEGRFDPTVKSPSHIGWEGIHLEGGTFSKEFDDTTIDLGGIAKGYCVDLITERLLEAGYPNLYVEWGGEIRANGQHPEGRPWQVFISRFGETDPSTAIAIVPLQNRAIATSGDYLQYTYQRGKKFSHILSPTDGSPLEVTSRSIGSASIATHSCAVADGLATAAMLFPTVEEAETWLKEIEEIEFWVNSRE